MAKLSKGVKSILEWVEVIAISVVLALVINLFVIQPIKVMVAPWYLPFKIRILS